MNRALRKEMRELRKSILKEKDSDARLLMASMYKDLYGQAFRDEDAERPMRIMRSFVRSSLLYLVLAILAIAVLSHYFGNVVIYCGGALVLCWIVAFAVLSMRTTNTISEEGMRQTLESVFTAIAKNNPFASTGHSAGEIGAPKTDSAPMIESGDFALNASNEASEGKEATPNTYRDRSSGTP